MSDGEKIVIKRVRKKGGHETHHGGAWKVAYADFVTAMMALFIVLWIVANNVSIRASVADYFRDPGAPGLSADEAGSTSTVRRAGLQAGWRAKFRQGCRVGP